MTCPTIQMPFMLFSTNFQYDKPRSEHSEPASTAFRAVPESRSGSAERDQRGGLVSSRFPLHTSPFRKRFEIHRLCPSPASSRYGPFIAPRRNASAFVLAAGELRHRLPCRVITMVSPCFSQLCGMSFPTAGSFASPVLTSISGIIARYFG